MSTITRERLRERAREKVKSLEFAVTQSAFTAIRSGLEEELELARIALASLEAEAVADVVAWYSPNEERTCDVRLRRHDIKPGALYTAPPAPVSVAGIKFPVDGDAVGYLGVTPLFSKEQILKLNTCRAAMLQGAEPVTKAYKLPDDFDFDRFNDVTWLDAVASNPHMHSLTTSTIAMVALELNKRLDAGNSPVIPDCWCRTCRPVTNADMRFVVCPVCGNKRCPKANDHRNACTGSNEPGQEGSAYPAAPQQEVK